MPVADPAMPLLQRPDKRTNLGRKRLPCRSPSNSLRYATAWEMIGDVVVGAVQTSVADSRPPAWLTIAWTVSRRSKTAERSVTPDGEDRCRYKRVIVRRPQQRRRMGRQRPLRFEIEPGFGEAFLPAGLQLGLGDAVLFRCPRGIRGQLTCGWGVGADCVDLSDDLRSAGRHRRHRRIRNTL